MKQNYKYCWLAASILLALSSAAHAYSEALATEFVDQALPHYLDIQKGLANDDLEMAQTATVDYLQVLQNQDTEELQTLAAASQGILDSDQLINARKEFRVLSSEMIQLTRDASTTQRAELYIATCPTAFNHQGAQWIQNHRTPQNPYFGTRLQHDAQITPLADQTSDDYIEQEYQPQQRSSPSMQNRYRGDSQNRYRHDLKKHAWGKR
ncbi:MAG: hypothetical protein ACI81V_000810 [Lentimonas sp.]|jgi:hypothetical protein